MEKTAAIIGAGLIGRSWAMVFARADWRVRLYDSVPAQLEAAATFIAASLAEIAGCFAFWVEGQLPTRTDLVGAALAIAGALVIIAFAARTR